MIYSITNLKTTTPTKTLSGRALAHQHLSASQRAALAAQILESEASIAPTVHQIATLLDVSVTYVQAARKLSPADRDLVAHGIDLCFADLLRHSAAGSGAKPVNLRECFELITS
jgi:hypothetical protein